MSDLDNEELIATRKLNGLDDNLYIDGNDTNVGSIENLKILLFQDNLTQYGKRKLIEYYEKKIKELEEENQRLKAKIDVVNWQEKTAYQCLKENYIPIQKVKAKIEELNDGIKRDMINYDKVQEESWKKAIHHSMHQKIETKKVLEELLEENNK